MSSPRPGTLDELDRDLLASGRRCVGWAMLAGPLPVGAASLALGLRLNDAVWTGVGAFHLLLCGALASVWFARTRQLGAFDAGATAGEVRFGRGFAATLGLFALLAPFGALLTDRAAASFGWLDGMLAAFPGLAPGGAPAISNQLAWIAVGVLALATTASALLALYLRTLSPEVLAEGPGLARWFRVATWITAVATVLCVFHAYGQDWGHALVARAVLFVVAALGLEILLRSLFLRGAWRRRTPPRTPVLFTELRSLRLLASHFNPVTSVFTALAEVFGLDLKGAWALGFIRRAILPLTLLLALIGWASTSLVMVHAHERGVHERFGELAMEPLLDPGLHLVLPWPMDRVHRVSVDRVRQVTIGYRGQQTGASMLWTSTHAEEEHKLLLGDGRDLVSINATLHYRVVDPLEFVYSLQNPEAALAASTDRILMRRTVERSLDELLGENLAAFAASIEEEVQHAARSQQLGLEVVDFTLSGLHPPVDVAPAYQAVVAARIEGLTRILEAEQYAAKTIPYAEGDIVRIVDRAESKAVQRTSLALGEAEAFTAVWQEYLRAPELFTLRRRLEVVEAILKGKPFHLLDHRIERDGGTVWLLD